MSDAPTPIKGPELDDMFMRGMAGLMGASLLMGAGAGLMNMGPMMRPVAALLQLDAMSGVANGIARTIDGPQRQQLPQMTPSGPR